MDMGTSADRLYERMVQSVRDYAICMLDPFGQVLTWNAAAERITGYRADEIVGRHLSLLYTEAERAAGRPEMTLGIATAQDHYSDEVYRARVDGGLFWACISIDAIRDAHGALLGFSVVMRDVTRRREVEQKLRASEQRFRLFVDGVAEYAICMLDPHGVVTDWNAGAERIKGYRAPEIIGWPLSCFFPDAGLAHEALDSARKKGRFQFRGWQLRKDGTRFLADVQIHAIRDSAGTLLGFADITCDVTEREQIAQRLEEARGQLFQSQKVEAIGQLTGGIAHDFNNLIQGIIGSLDVIEMRMAHGNTQDAGRFLSHALASARRAAVLIKRLLAFIRREPAHCEEVNVNQVIESMLPLLGPALHRIDLSVELAPGLPPAICDANQLENALLNLAINARDAMPHGGRVIVRTGHSMHDGGHLALGTGGEPAPYVCVQVADNGPGMPEDVRARAFEPFFTTKPKDTGTGLGLSMVHRFVEEASGHVELASEPGRGTVVSIYLPCHERRSVERSIDA